jgi:hypothetical protein
MNLRRYNEVLFAVLMSGAVIVAVAYGIHDWARWREERAADARMTHGPGAIPTNDMSGRSVAVCLPSFAAGTDFQYFPVASVRTQQEMTNGPIAAWTSNLGEACHLGEGVSGGIFDVVIRNSATNEQRLALNHPGQVLDMTLPDPACSSGAGSVPCATVFWLLRDEDSNQDGVVDARDNAVLYVSDLSAKQLFRLSPKDASVLDWVWNSRSGEVLMQIRRSAGGTEVVNARLQPPAPGISVVQAQTLEQLQRAAQ